MEQKKMYMIIDNKTGMYKTAGMWGGWAKRWGKLWSLADLKKHLRLYDGYGRKLIDQLRLRYGSDLEQISIVEVELVRKDNTKPLIQFLKEDMGEDVS